MMPGECSIEHKTYNAQNATTSPLFMASTGFIL